MSWPTPQDYNEAIQAPAISFDDAGLKLGSPELSPLGLPRPITGAFASVYKFHCLDKDWAVRCFLRNAEFLQERYQQLTKYLPEHGTQFTAGFQYCVRGIRLRAQWYPILKMEWVEGKSLDQFVDQFAANQRVLNELAERFRSLAIALIRNGLAHGDLQHGNLLVVPAGVKIVDYDGMYAPEFKGWKALELGHANYQHPLRTASHFGPYLDNFSAWIIYTSLLILAKDQSLWSQLNGGDECILFRRSDYANPYTSYTFSVLEHHPSAEINRMARALRALLKMRPEEIPNLAQALPPPPEMPDLPEPEILAGTRILKGSWSDGQAPAVIRSDWPKVEYLEQAVQQPNTFFKDRELRRCQFSFEASSGRHGYVCHLKGVKQLAAKCFFKEQSDREVRFHEIKRVALSGPAKQYFIDFEYQPEGIHARGKWFPILKMEWLQGPTLDSYALERLSAGDRHAVDNVLNKFRTMVTTLNHCGIAHGDLEARNIIVTAAGLKLVDYDNMFVPSLTGLRSIEFGEPLYQHPQRSLHHFGPYIDNYPGWVIDNALTFLSVYPNTFHWGWDYIVERIRSDELNYTNSVTNKAVDPVVTVAVTAEVRRRAHLMSLLQQIPIEQIPPLIDDLSSNLLKREALMASINSLLQRFDAPSP